LSNVIQIYNTGNSTNKMEDILTNPKTTVAQLNIYAKEHNITVPSKLKKAEKIAYIKAQLQQKAKTGYRKEVVNWFLFGRMQTSIGKNTLNSTVGVQYL
jgi:hypothetical protein